MTYLNPIAEQMTDWAKAEAQGRLLSEIFHIVNEKTNELAPSAIDMVLKSGQVAGLANDTLLIQRGGNKFAIEDSAAPIRDRAGTIIGVVLVFHDVSEARKMAAQMTHQVTHDALTGLINRHELERRVERSIDSGRNDKKQHTLLYLDLDQFKIVNDTCGDVAGDELLRKIGVDFGQGYGIGKSAPSYVGSLPNTAAADMAATS